VGMIINKVFSKPQWSPTRLFKKTGATSDAFQLRFLWLPTVGGRAAYGAIIRPPARDRTIHVRFVAPLTLTLDNLNGTTNLECNKFITMAIIHHRHSIHMSNR
jgi:hypothetical protein